MKLNLKKLEVDIQVIVHATEDINRIFSAFEDIFRIGREEFSMQNLQGHYDNPIILLTCKLGKKKAQSFVQDLIKNIPASEIEQLYGDLEDRCDKSALHLRISKQELVLGRITLGEQDPIKLRIYTPVYTQKDLIGTYAQILRQAGI